MNCCDVLEIIGRSHDSKKVKRMVSGSSLSSDGERNTETDNFSRGYRLPAVREVPGVRHN